MGTGIGTDGTCTGTFDDKLLLKLNLNAYGTNLLVYSTSRVVVEPPGTVCRLRQHQQPIF